MGLPIRRAALLLLLSLTGSGSAVLAQSLTFGRDFPLTNTRYDNLGVNATFASKGNETFLVWGDGGVVRITEVAEGPSRIGRLILPAHSNGAPGAVWTGTHFLVAGANGLRVLNADGEPLGGPFTLVPLAHITRLASNGRNVMMVASTSDAHLYKLTTGGALLEPGAQLIDHLAGFDETAIASNGTGYAIVTGVADGIRVTMLDENGNIRSQQLVFGSAYRRGPPAIASDGQRYLAVWNDADESVRAVSIEANGAIGQPFVIATRPDPSMHVGVGAVVWMGNRYAVAYSQTNAGGESVFVSVRSVDAQTRTTSAIVQLPASGHTRPSLAFSQNRLLLSSETSEGTLVRDLTRGGDPIRAAWAARNQRVLGAASSADATMTVWAEDLVYAGLRRSDGAWIETALTGHAALVASNGQEFVVITYSLPSSPGIATRFDANGGRHSTATTIPFHPHAVTWTGSEYAIVGTQGHDLVAALLSDSGTLGPVVFLRRGDELSFHSASVASDGTNVFVVWGETEFFPCFPPCSGVTERVRTTLLTHDLRPLTPPLLTELAVGEQEFEHVRVVWDGSQYVAVYGRRSGGLFARRISHAGTPKPSITLTNGDALTVSTARVGNAVAVSWTSASSTLVDEIRLIGSGITNVGAFARQSLIFEHALAALPGARLAFIAAERLDAEPYYGSERLTMMVGDVAPPASVPDAPRASVRVDGERLRVTWTAPPQPVNGYRLEYKVGNGSWTELERWFTPGQTEVALTLSPRRSTIYSFRLRAWSDSGTSGYSQPASVFLGKRRSVR